MVLPKYVVMVCVYSHLLNNVKTAGAADLEKIVAEILAADLIKHAVMEWHVVAQDKYAVLKAVKMLQMAVQHQYQHQR